MTKNPELYAGNSILTYSGHYLDVFNPDPEKICIEDIAKGLSVTPRFAGQLEEPYYVAQHCVMGSLRPNDPATQFAFLLHDASEAYLGDQAKPIKNGLPDYKELEDQLMKAICARFNIAWPMRPVIKELDRQMLEHEHRCLRVEKKGLITWGHHWAYHNFMIRFMQLDYLRKL